MYKEAARICSWPLRNGHLQPQTGLRLKSTIYSVLNEQRWNTIEHVHAKKTRTNARKLLCETFAAFYSVKRRERERERGKGHAKVFSLNLYINLPLSLSLSLSTFISTPTLALYPRGKLLYYSLSFSSQFLSLSVFITLSLSLSLTHQRERGRQSKCE